MTAALAERFDRVLALDVSPAMLERARAAVPDERVEFRAVSGERLDGVDDELANVARLLPRPAAPAVARRRPRVPRRVRPRARSRAARRSCSCRCSTTDCARAPGARLRSALVPLTSLGPTRRREFRGFRLTRRELDSGLERVGLRVVATDVGPDAPYRYSRDLFLRLTR